MASTEFATRSHKGAGFLFLLGFALLAAGVGFAFAPQFSWQVTKIARQASALGLENGTLVVGGLILFGLGIVARVANSAPPAPDTRAESEALQSELHLINEQLSTKLAQVRTSLLQVSDGVTTVVAQQQAQMQSEGGQPSGGDHAGDAVFRLAASLDKLHAHLDERVHGIDLQLRSGFESLLNTTQDLRRLLGQGQFAAQSQPASHGHAPGAPSGIDFYQTMQKLDAIAGSENELGGNPQAPFPSHGQAASPNSLDALLPEEYRNRY